MLARVQTENKNYNDKCISVQNKKYRQISISRNVFIVYQLETNCSEVECDHGDANPLWRYWYSHVVDFFTEQGMPSNHLMSQTTFPIILSGTWNSSSPHRQHYKEHTHSLSHGLTSSDAADYLPA